MKETPMLFKPQLVRSIRKGEKTQTRRIAKQLTRNGDLMSAREGGINPVTGKYFLWGEFDGEDTEWGIPSPFGGPGDRIYVRETHLRMDSGEIIPISRIMHDIKGMAATKNAPGCKTIPGIHMKKVDCQTWLEIVSVRLERISDLSNDDAIDEGIEETPDGWKGYAGGESFRIPRQAFASLWNSVYGQWAKTKGGFECWPWSPWYANTTDAHVVGQGNTLKVEWGGDPKRSGTIYANPWVWAVTFKVIESIGEE